MSRTGARLAVAAVIGAVAAAGCGGGRARPTAVRRQCRAAIGFIGAAQQPLARQQLAFAQLAVAHDNASQHTRISLVAAPNGGSTSLAADRFAAGAVVAVVGPASNAEVQAAGSVFARSGLAFISGSATGPTLTSRANPTFFRVVPSDSVEGTQLSHFVITRIRPRGTVLLIDDGAPASRQLIRTMSVSLRSARIPVASVTGAEGVTPVGTVAARITPLVTDAVLGWHVASQANQLGRVLGAQRKAVPLVGSSQLFDPSRFTIPGSFVDYWAPDITALPADASLVQQARQSMGSFGIDAPPTYAATHVIDSAIAAVCGAGKTPSRSGVLAAVRATDESRSVLGIPIRFRPNGDLTEPRWFMFRIQPGGRYLMLPPR
jgi:branched-chain amino acid transport system substrate-binding protein